MYNLKCPIQFHPPGDLHYMAVQLFVSFPMGSFHKGASTILCFFLECFPDISSKTSCYCALSNPFLTPFIKVLQQYQQEHLFPFLTCTFSTLANNICQTQRCPFTFYLLSSVQTFLLTYHLSSIRFVVLIWYLGGLSPYIVHFAFLSTFRPHKQGVKTFFWAKQK